jgi:hypothetical protein
MGHLKGLNKVCTPQKYPGELVAGFSGIRRIIRAASN